MRRPCSQSFISFVRRVPSPESSWRMHALDDGRALVMWPDRHDRLHLRVVRQDGSNEAVAPPSRTQMAPSDGPVWRLEWAVSGAWALVWWTTGSKTYYGGHYRVLHL